MARTGNSVLSGHNRARILFAPTFRKYQSLADTLKNAGLYATDLQAVLKQQNLELWIKPHYLDESEMGEISLPPRVKWLITQSINDNFGEFSALITDYSSVFYDASVAGLAVGFVSHDIDFYVANDTELYEWFRKLVVSSGSESLSVAIEKLSRQGGVDLNAFLGVGRN
jgi:CDP-glycerol glycerophosphotransferase (TagB/SpsB family)